MPLLILFVVIGILGSSSFMTSLPVGQTTPPTFPTPTPVKSHAGKYCLTQEEFDEIKSRPLAFTCDRTDIDQTVILEENVPYVLAEENVLVSRIFRHEQKQLILKEVCNDESGNTNYYTWKCHPPSWGSIYSNTLWKLRDSDPNRAPLKDGDYFDVYLRGDLDSLPDRWRCPDAAAAALAAKALAESPLEDKIIRIGTQSAIWKKRDQVSKHEIETVPPREKVAEITLEEQDYDVFVNLLIESSPDRDVYLYLIEKGLLPETEEDLPDEIIYDVFLILYETDPKGKTLKLATFDPRPPPKQEHGWWDVYIPESKPIVYLYPEKPTLLNFKINVKDGYVTVSDPPYDPENGWNVMAYPDGSLEHLGGGRVKRSETSDSSKVKKTNYPYLYYETMIKGYEIPENGWAVKKEKLLSFFDQVLPQLGLNKKESQDFTEYWIPRLENEVSTDYIFTTFIPQAQIENVDSFEISSLDLQDYPEFIQDSPGIHPTTQIRVRAYFQPLEEWKEVTPQALPSPSDRVGFTLVEWGGILDSN